MNKKNVILIGLSFVFIILISLSALIYFHSLNLNCNKCYIEFKNNEIFGMKLEEPQIINISFFELYSNLNNNKCSIVWNRNQGYMYNGERRFIKYEN